MPTARIPNKWQMASVLATGIMLGLLGALVLLAFHEVPANNKDLFNIALMAVVGNAGIAFGYHMGSSKGGELTKEMLRDALTAKTPQQPTP